MRPIFRLLKRVEGLEVDRGFEREIAKRLAYWQRLRDRAGAGGDPDDGE